MNIQNLWTPRHIRPDGSRMYTWGETDTRYCLPRITVNRWHEERSTLSLGLVFIAIYINLPKIGNEHGIEQGGYGFYFSDDALVLEWGKKNKFLYYPWSWSHYKYEVLAQGWGNKEVGWITIPRDIPTGNIPKRWKAPYTYTLKSGVVQKRVATYYVDRREWRWRWLMWLPWFGLRATYIDVSFNDEVGEQTGTWKGGTIGCSYEMRRGETPLQTLRRMEQERKF